MKATIAIQMTCIPEQELLEERYALEELGITPIWYGLIPFADEITNSEEFVNYDRVVPFGTVKLLKLWMERKLPPQCVIFYDHAKFDQHFYAGAVGPHLLNYPAKYYKLGDVKDQELDRPVFVKPTHDLKAFGGLVVHSGHTIGQEVYGRMHDSALTDEEEILVADVRDDITREYRNFVVGGELVDSCIYKIGSRVTYEPMTAEEREQIVAYFKNTKHAYQPGDTYVVDYARLENGDFKIIEFNDIHCSGMYCIDRRKLFKAIMERIS